MRKPGVGRALETGSRVGCGCGCEIEYEGKEVGVAQVTESRGDTTRLLRWLDWRCETRGGAAAACWSRELPE